MKDELSICDGLVFKGECLVVPQGHRAKVKKDIHALDAGVEGCLRRARDSVFWPGMNSELRHWISTCEPCRLFEILHGKETLIHVCHEVPQMPWEKVVVDLFSLNQKDYLVTFARCGSLCQLVSDNGPQFVAAEFQKMTKAWDIEHRVTSPYNSKANGKVEAAIKFAKRLLHKTAKAGDDFHLGLLGAAAGSSYRQNRAHLKRTNELPPEVTTNKSPQASNNPDMTAEPD